MKQILSYLFDYKTLDSATAKEILVRLTQGHFNQSEMAAFMTVYLMRSITVEELQGFRDAMMEQCLAIDLSDFDTIDLCGTGGDGKNTFNISTLSAFVVAGAGQPVAKHGNYGVSSICGSSNLLAHFGYQFTADRDKLLAQLEAANICFLHAPLFHPAMKNVAPIRKELGMKTFFNMLGPMVNPANPRKQLVGVFSLELLRLYQYLYQQSGKQFSIVHALDGYDEISLTGSFKLAGNQGERILEPEDISMERIAPEELFGGDTIEESARIFLRILEGDGTLPQHNAVVANAGAALSCAHQLSLEDGIAMASESLVSGKALNAFRKLIVR